MEALISILSIYFFILIGFMAKKTFEDDINEKTLILLSIYFLQPMLTFWGLTRAPIDYKLIFTPVLYFIIITVTLIFLILVSKKLFKDSKEQSIFIVASLIGNTGNLGIPLGIALFGEDSVPYTSIINIANIFFIYTIGIYFYAKDKFNFKQSINSMIKIPILWFAILALIYNYLEFPINTQIDKVLQMGAYATIVLQLIIFGVYLSRAKIKSHNYKLSASVTLVKLIILPLIGLGIILVSGLDNYIASILMVSLIVPLAVNNVNISALYDCKPLDVTAVVFISTILFLLILYFDLEIIHLNFNFK
ncbi:MAG: AEC family transporter [Arcobacteraceae bacterium]|nr:AEC family transporter [Arcobacteraceae bacterium]